MVKMSSEQHSSKKLCNSVKDSHTTIIHPVRAFELKSSSSMDFESRSLNVFNKLNSLEMAHNTWMSANETYDSFDLNNTAPSKTSNVFKEPFAPGFRNQKSKYLPYKRNMKKWIKYSLQDVPMLSDKKNASVALQFLHELQRNKNCKEKHETSVLEKKIEFRRSSKRNLEGWNSVISSTKSSSNSIAYHHSQ